MYHKVRGSFQREKGLFSPPTFYIKFSSSLAYNFGDFSEFWLVTLISSNVPTTNFNLQNE